MLTVEYESPTEDAQPCECCGGVTTRLTRFVYRAGDAYAVYKAVFSNHHPAGTVSVLIGIGEWGEDASEDERCSFYLLIRGAADCFQVSVRDAAESPWGHVEVLGRTLDRAEALTHPRIKDVFEISDDIVAEDAPIVHFFSQATGND